MRCDLLIHKLVAIDAQLRRMRHLAAKIGSDAEFRARLPLLIASTSQELHRLMSELGQQEGWRPGETGPDRR